LSRNEAKKERIGVLRRPGGSGPIDPRRVAGYGFVAGMVLAPFLALVYGWNAGLGVMTFALAATTYLAFDSYRTAPPDLRPRLRPLVIVNAALTLACFAVLLVRVQ
jgi:hypothetical protein